MNAKPQGCSGCPALTQGRSYVPGAGPRDARVLIYGQGPGDQEATTGIPFIGQSGRRLDHWLHFAGLRRHAVHVDNVVRCWLPKDRPPRVAEVAHCRPAWQPTPTTHPNVRVVVAVGVPAMNALLDGSANADDAGRVYRLDREPWSEWPHPVYGVAVLHPANIARGNWSAEPFQILSLERARWIAERGEWPLTDPMTPPPGAILEPTLEEFVEWANGVDAQGVSVDIETTGKHIVCIGLCRISDLVSIVVHVLGLDAKPYWDSASWPTVRRTLDSLFKDANVPKVFHNGQAFDVLILENMGFEVRGFDFDTLLAQHIAYAEMRASKGLEVCARLYSGAGPWKYIVGDVEGDWK